MAGCSSPAAPSGSAAGRSIVIGAGSEPDNLNPILGFGPDGSTKVFDGLVSRDANLNLTPALADQLPTASPDGLTWTATLRQGVTFSDGTPLSAQDVVFTFASVLNPKVTSEIASNYDALQSVTAPDDRTEPAQLPILYPSGDTLRKDLELATASDLATLGIDAPVEGTTFELMLKRQREAAAIWGGGDPYDPDSAAYTLLNSSYIGQPGYVDMTLYRNAAVDAALDTGRRSLDPAVRKRAYDDFQTAYLADPGWAFLVFLDHTYMLRDRWDGLAPQVEPHDHGLLHAAWWNLEKWTPRS